MAVGSLVASNINLGAIREGSLFASKGVVVSNVGSSEDAFTDDLVAAVGATTGSVTATSTMGRVAAGTTDSGVFSVGYGGSTSTAGTVSGTAGVLFQSSGQVGTGLGVVNAAVAGGTVVVSGELLPFFNSLWWARRW